MTTTSAELRIIGARMRPALHRAADRLVDLMQRHPEDPRPAHLADLAIATLDAIDADPDDEPGDHL